MPANGPVVPCLVMAVFVPTVVLSGCAGQDTLAIVGERWDAPRELVRVDRNGRTVWRVDLPDFVSSYGIGIRYVVLAGSRHEVDDDEQPQWRLRVHDAGTGDLLRIVELPSMPLRMKIGGVRMIVVDQQVGRAVLLAIDRGPGRVAWKLLTVDLTTGEVDANPFNPGGTPQALIAHDGDLIVAVAAGIHRVPQDTLGVVTLPRSDRRGAWVSRLFSTRDHGLLGNLASGHVVQLLDAQGRAPAEARGTDLMLFAPEQIKKARLDGRGYVGGGAMDGSVFDARGDEHVVLTAWAGGESWLVLVRCRDLAVRYVELGDYNVRNLFVGRERTRIGMHRVGPEPRVMEYDLATGRFLIDRGGHNAGVLGHSERVEVLGRAD